ncbi:toll-like receptor 4 [Saccostrea echinata]|uniref:toll-like receptor 4 n=1 Tax=Saccostrea echinata TaxID=191078 RepID=UPI002A809414|nr:toll-like receptor 4 [Saccostrea echinata]
MGIHVNCSKRNLSVIPHMNDSITWIDLSKNNIKMIQTWTFPDNAFANLYSISSIKFNGIANKRFGKRFLRLKNLKVLDMSGIEGKCVLEYIDSNMFSNFLFLEVLDISYCNVKDIDKGSFSNMPKLQYLNISYNRQLGFASLPNVTFNLNKTKIKSLNINGVNCVAGVGTELKCHHLLSLKETNLTALHVGSNRLEILEPGVFKNLPKTLEKLSMDENKLTSGPYILEFNMLENLRVFNASFQKHPPKFPNSIVDICIEKRELFKDVFHCQEVANNQTLKNIGADSSFIWHFPRNLEEIYAFSSRLYFKVPEFNISAPSLWIIKLQDNFLYSFEGPVHIQPTNNQITLDVSNNFCSHISTFAMKNGGQLQNFNISHNDIGQDLEKDAMGKHLSP